jgi:hypothetical protein
MVTSDHYQDRDNQSPELHKGNYAGDNGDPVSKTPTIGWIFWSAASVSLEFVLCLIGQYLYDERRFFGAALFRVGMLLGALGFLIWWPTYSALWRWTWRRIL